MARRTAKEAHFFSNGRVMVFDAAGEQIGRYQIGNHADTVAALKRDGLEWWQVCVFGVPERDGGRRYSDEELFRLMDAADAEEGKA